jgi:hypothetical protein
VWIKLKSLGLGFLGGEESRGCWEGSGLAGELSQHPGQKPNVHTDTLQDMAVCSKGTDGLLN